MPKDGITYLDNVPRFDALGFDSAKSNNIYILCSDQCRQIAKQEHGFVPAVATERRCPEPIDVSFGFGEGKTLEEEISGLHKEQETGLDKAMRKLRASTVRPPPPPVITKKPVKCDEYRQWLALPVSQRAIEKICPITGNVLGVYTSMEDAAETIQRTYAVLYNRLSLKSPTLYGNFQWKLTNISQARKPIVPAKELEVIDMTGDVINITTNVIDLTAESPPTVPESSLVMDVYVGNKPFVTSGLSGQFSDVKDASGSVETFSKITPECEQSDGANVEVDKSFSTSEGARNSNVANKLFDSSVLRRQSNDVKHAASPTETCPEVTSY